MSSTCVVSSTCVGSVYVPPVGLNQLRCVLRRRMGRGARGQEGWSWWWRRKRRAGGSCTRGEGPSRGWNSASRGRRPRKVWRRVGLDLSIEQLLYDCSTAASGNFLATSLQLNRVSHLDLQLNRACDEPKQSATRKNILP